MYICDSENAFINIVLSYIAEAGNRYTSLLLLFPLFFLYRIKWWIFACSRRLFQKHSLVGFRSALVLGYYYFLVFLAFVAPKKKIYIYIWESTTKSTSSMVKWALWSSLLVDRIVDSSVASLVRVFYTHFIVGISILYFNRDANVYNILFFSEFLLYFCIFVCRVFSLSFWINGFITTLCIFIKQEGWEKNINEDYHPLHPFSNWSKNTFENGLQRDSIIQGNLIKIAPWKLMFQMASERRVVRGSERHFSSCHENVSRILILYLPLKVLLYSIFACVIG